MHVTLRREAFTFHVTRFGTARIGHVPASSRGAYPCQRAVTKLKVHSWETWAYTPYHAVAKTDRPTRAVSLVLAATPSPNTNTGTWLRLACSENIGRSARRACHSACDQVHGYGDSREQDPELSPKKGEVPILRCCNGADKDLNLESNVVPDAVDLSTAPVPESSQLRPWKLKPQWTSLLCAFPQQSKQSFCPYLHPRRRSRRETH
jgi:hypothetical protein